MRGGNRDGVEVEHAPRVGPAAAPRGPLPRDQVAGLQATPCGGLAEVGSTPQQIGQVMRRNAKMVARRPASDASRVGGSV